MSRITYYGNDNIINHNFVVERFTWDQTSIPTGLLISLPVVATSWAELQTALLNITSVYGGIINLPAGTYTATEPITLPRGVMIAGAGVGVTRILVANDTGAFIVAGDNVTLGYMDIIQDVANTGYGISIPNANFGLALTHISFEDFDAGPCINANNEVETVKELVIDNCNFVDCVERNINLQNAENVIITKCYFANGVLADYPVWVQGNNIKFVANVVSQTSMFLIFVAYGNNIVFNSNNFFIATGISIFGYAEITDNNFNDCDGNIISFLNHSNPEQKSIIAGNLIDTNVGEAIIATNYQNSVLVVKGNVILTALAPYMSFNSEGLTILDSNVTPLSADFTDSVNLGTGKLRAINNSFIGFPSIDGTPVTISTQFSRLTITNIGGAVATDATLVALPIESAGFITIFEVLDTGGAGSLVINAGPIGFISVTIVEGQNCSLQWTGSQWTVLDPGTSTVVP